MTQSHVVKALHPVLPTFADVEAAAVTLEDRAHRTPIFTSRRLDALLGARVYLKAENLQRTGAFKFRGAYTALSALTPEQGRQGVVTFSSGNHAQAIALAGALLGIPTVVVMPEDAPVGKLAATRGYGAEVITFDRRAGDREAIAAELSAERGLTLIPPYDHAAIVAGQGTAVRELLMDVPQLDLVMTPLGGGGLLAGSALATRALAPAAEIWGVEPEAGDDGRQSLAEGHIVHIATPETIADGAQTQHLGEITFAILRRDVTGVLTASDAGLAAAMRVLAEGLKLVVEPTGALALAGLIAARACEPGRWSGASIGLVLSGGNVDLPLFARLICD